MESKEQTPMPPEEFLDQDEFVDVQVFLRESGTLRTTTALMEQYAQAKVSEALEKITIFLQKVNRDIEYGGDLTWQTRDEAKELLQKLITSKTKV